jgi:hypothetical protein
MIKRLLDSGVAHQAIADRFGCSRVVVTEIHTGKYYAHVTDDTDDAEPEGT